MRSRHLDDRELERQPRVASLTHVLDRDGEQIDEPQNRRLGELVRLLAQELLGLLGHRERLRNVAHVLDEQEVAQVLEQVVDEAAEILPLLGELLDEDERSCGVAVDDHVAEPKQRVLFDRPDELENGLGIDRAVRCGGKLVERRDRVSERSVRAPGDQREGGVLGLDPFSLGYAPKEHDELGEPRALEDERLAARAHGRDDLDEIGGAEDEEEMGRGLLDQLEERIPSGVRQLVRLVEDVDLVTPLDGLQHDALPNLADVVDAALGGRIHLDHIERGSVRDRNAHVAGLVRGRCGAPGADAVQCLREDPRHRRLPRSTRPGEEVGLTHLVVLDRILQRSHDRLLPDDLVEALRTVLPVERAHFVDSSRCGATREKPGRALRRRDEHPRRYPRRRLGSGGTAAPERESLALLPSGPDAVRTLPVRGTRSVNTACEDPVPKTPPLGRHSAPHGADLGFREPLPPHLARPGMREGSKVSA